MPGLQPEPGAGSASRNHLVAAGVCTAAPLHHIYSAKRLTYALVGTVASV